MKALILAMLLTLLTPINSFAVDARLAPAFIAMKAFFQTPTFEELGDTFLLRPEFVTKDTKFYLNGKEIDYLPSPAKVTIVHIEFAWWQFLKSVHFQTIKERYID